MPGPRPNFSPFPFDQLPRRTRREAALESAVARWLAGQTAGGKLAALLGGQVQARLIGTMPSPPDPHAAWAEARGGGLVIALAAPERLVRGLAQRLLGGPAELAAPRPLTVVEQAIWALVVSAALVDLDVAGEVWPLSAGPPAGAVTMAFAVELPAELGLVATVTASFPPDIALRPLVRPLPTWPLDLPIVVGRCALPRDSLVGLAVRDVITFEPRLELVVGRGGIGLSAAAGAVEARVATEYVSHDMAALDDAAAFELTVQLGTVQLSLRQLGELAIGALVPLGRPLAGPYEVRVAGRLVAHGELVDIDGELGVRIVSIADQPAEPARAASQQ